MKSSYQKLRRHVRKSDSFWVESAKIDFVIELSRLIKRADISYAQLAEKLGKSPAYVSKVFAGNENLTIESMVKLTRALNGNLHIHAADDGCEVRWFDIIKNVRKQDNVEHRRIENFKQPHQSAIVNIEAIQVDYAAA